MEARNPALHPIISRACANLIDRKCGAEARVVVACLSMIVSNDTVLEQKHRVKKICRKELKLELLEKHSDVKFDPALHEACKLYLNKHCADIEHQAEDGGLECLKGSKKVRIEPLVDKFSVRCATQGPSKTCRAQVFKEEKEEAEDSEVDFALMRGCRREVKMHCAEQPADSMLQCLKDFSSQENFDQKCLGIIRGLCS